MFMQQSRATPSTSSMPYNVPLASFFFCSRSSSYRPGAESELYAASRKPPVPQAGSQRVTLVKLNAIDPISRSTMQVCDCYDDESLAVQTVNYAVGKSC